jgi:RNA polymerase sigma factor (sigma-70 family)
MPGGRDEVAALFDGHYARLTGLAFVILGDREVAEEAVMDAFVKALSPKWRRRRVEDPAAYLRTVVVNECRGRIRRVVVDRRAVAKLEGRVARPTHRDAELYLDVWRQVRSLPERQRLCVVLRYGEDMTEAAIADALECSEGTVKSQLSKARSKLAVSLGDLREGAL